MYFVNGRSYDGVYEIMRGLRITLSIMSNDDEEEVREEDGREACEFVFYYCDRSV